MRFKTNSMANLSGPSPCWGGFRGLGWALGFVGRTMGCLWVCMRLCCFIFVTKCEGNASGTRNTFTNSSLDWKGEFCSLLPAESPSQGNGHFGQDWGPMEANRAYFRVTRGCPNPSELSTDLLYMPGDVQRCSEMLRGAQKWSGNHRSRQFLSKEQSAKILQESVKIPRLEFWTSRFDPYIPYEAS